MNVVRKWPDYLHSDPRFRGGRLPAFAGAGIQGPADDVALDSGSRLRLARNDDVRAIGRATVRCDEMNAVVRQSSSRLLTIGESDLDEIMSIERRAYSHPWTIGIFHDCMRVGYCCAVYEQDGAIDAYSLMSVAAAEAHILNLCVRPESQRQGIGRKILGYLIATARRLIADNILLEVRPSNHGALQLYKPMGFHEVGMRRQYYPAHNGPEDALILSRAL